MYYYLDVETSSGIERHILMPLSDGGVMSFPLTDNNPNKAAYDQWVEDGNVATEWTPDTANRAK